MMYTQAVEYEAVHFQLVLATPFAQHLLSLLLLFALDAPQDGLDFSACLGSGGELNP